MRAPGSIQFKRAELMCLKSNYNSISQYHRWILSAPPGTRSGDTVVFPPTISDSSLWQFHSSGLNQYKRSVTHDY